MTSPPSSFHERSAAALANQQLRATYRFATQLTLSKRAQVVAGLPFWEETRERARTIKAEALNQLDTYLEQLEKNATAHRIKVHWAPSAAEALQCMGEIIRTAGTRTVVKAKSMTTEEIGLNHFLEHQGLEVLETDLGEYIVQLAGETPSHLTAPALHKNRQQIGTLFSEKLGIPYTDSPEELCEVARRLLRQKFLEAGVGISGVNFAIAETGTLVVVENEGNARMCTTLPRVHIALMGIEKIIPRLRDLPVFLKLLPASATGQKATSYVSLIHAPRLAAADGPEEIHLVLLDNGRSRILADRNLRPVLSCIRCGACLNVCPVYQRIGGHAYGSIYSGPIGSILTPALEADQKGGELPFASSLCGACSEICPVKIELHHLLLYLRHKLTTLKKTGIMERVLMKSFRKGMQQPFLYRAGLRIMRFATKAGIANWGKSPLAAWTQTRVFPQPAPRSFREIWKESGNRQSQ